MIVKEDHNKTFSYTSCCRGTFISIITDSELLWKTIAKNLWNKRNSPLMISNPSLNNTISNKILQ